MYGPLYRRVLLPLFDRLKGRRTLAYWAELEQSQWLPRETHAERQLLALQNLLAHAETHCSYYTQDWQARGLRSARVQSQADFEAWPLTTRETIRTHRLAMRSDVAQKLITKATGGSSGQPLQFDLNADSHERRTAQMYRGYGWAGGAPGTKQLYLWGGALANVSRTRRWKMALHNAFDRKLMINCFEFTPERMRAHVNAWNRYRPDVVVAYTTPLDDFARFVEETGARVTPPHAFIVGAEKLYPHQRERIERVLQAPVFETYGSREFMLLGAECDRHRGLHLSQENVYVEVVDDAGRPAEPGTEGHVVVTDLFNYGMPFIRYVNGDRAVAGWEQCPCGRGLPLLRQVVGRRTDTLTTPDGRRIPGTFFPHLFKEFARIRRFQVVQELPDAFTIRLVAPELEAHERDALLHLIAATTGPAVRLQLDLVDDIPLTAQGKHQVVVNRLPAENTADHQPGGSLFSHSARKESAFEHR